MIIGLFLAQNRATEQHVPKVQPNFEKCATESFIWFISSISPFEFPELLRFGNLQFSEFPFPFRSRFHENPAGLLTEKLSWYSLN